MRDDFLRRVDWAQLQHAYGKAQDVPRILRQMISPDPKTRDLGWDNFYGAVNHQGDYYDSTVAAFQFLADAIRHPDVPDRGRLLDYFRSRLEDAEEYGGDPHLPDPPGGRDVPTPMRSDDAPPDAAEPDADDEEYEVNRPMELCAWQVGRVILAATPAYEELLTDPDAGVAAAAAVLLLRRADTRAAGKRTLARLVQREPDPLAQARRVLEFGVYVDAADEPTLAGWVAADRPLAVRAAAALVWAWLADPQPLPAPAAAAIREAADPACDVFGRLPWVGVYHRGPWVLPANAADLPLRLAGNADTELRWRGVQGLEAAREPMRHVPPAAVVPVLVRALADPTNRVRNTAAFALSQRGPAAFDHAPDLVPRLLAVFAGGGSPAFGSVRGFPTDDATACGHAARLLAMAAARLTPDQKRDAVAAIGRAADRYAGQPHSFVMFDSSGTGTKAVLDRQQELIERPEEWNLPKLFEAFAWCEDQDAELSPRECDERLADAYAADPAGTVAAAVAALAPDADRSAGLGAGKWLATLGPAAGPALPALDRLAADGPDEYANEQAAKAAAWVRRTLDDVEASVVGVAGRYECDGRLYHWRQERRSPRAAAVAPGRVPAGDRLLTAMLAESAEAAVVCGGRGVPARFTPAEWDAAVAAAGGFAAAEPRLRAARQAARNAECPDDEAAPGVASACATELGSVIRRLSGRRV